MNQCVNRDSPRTSPLGLTGREEVPSGSAFSLAPVKAIRKEREQYFFLHRCEGRKAKYQVLVGVKFR